MAIKLKYFLAGEAGGLNKQTGRIDMHGIFDVLTSPIFPIVIPNMAILIGIEANGKEQTLELRLNSPKDELLGKIQVTFPPTYPGLTAKQTLKLEKLPVILKGKYTVDILEVKAKGGYQFIATEDLFTAVFPPKREFAEGEIEEILKRDDVIKTVVTDYKVPDHDEVFKFQLSLDPNEELPEGVQPFPEDDKLVVDEKEYDLTGIRRNIEWMFGRKKQQPKPEENNSENTNETVN
ncbi:MAG: hypothetical protein PWP46_1294 [Fusobacteriaceae bacterium]|jgi:hypothetical protein|nr:hypothetical protein [Fusobacteriales bacterium]MDN5304410.1 hypothetical protein [Fusobacteriaceae bacterium]